MALKVAEGRWTAEVPEQGVTVFLIGMRFNRLWRVDKWYPVFTEMPRMLRHLATEPDSALLGWHAWFGRTTLMLSYWRDTESLMAFAGDSTAPHAAAWQRYMRDVGTDGTVGIWHETYVVQPGSVEAVYGNMPVFGLAAATSHVSVTRGTGTARRRLARNTGVSHGVGDTKSVP
jgi:hypothetical protein